MSLELSRKALAVKPSSTLAITAKANELKKMGMDIVSFTAGEPDFNTPAHICMAAHRAIDDGFTKYTPVSGITELKEAIVKKFHDFNRIDYTTDQIVVSNGGNKLYFAPLFDYGAGNYNSYLSDGTHGHGTSNYYAGGFIFRKMNKKSGFYYEGSARLGRAHSNFASNDFKMGDLPIHLSYSVSAPIYAGHVHLGQIYSINRENTFQIYGQYFHTYQGGMDTHLSTGEDYEFNSINSGRFRAGCRLIRQTPNKKNRLYSGLAYQYEFNGDSSARYKGYSTRESSMKGSSGMIELGWQLKPTKESPLMVDLGVVGWIGYQKGVTCQVKFKKAF